jgi:hypothetical protein
MLALICAVVAVVLWAIAALAPSAPPFDRARLIAAGLAFAWVPVLVHAAQTR